MRILKRLVLTVLILLAILLVIGFFLPSEFGTSRSVVIDAPPEVIFEQVSNLRKNEAWSAWKEDDPTLVTTYNDVESGVGASYSWTSEKSGAGTLAWVASDPPRHLKYSLVFEGQGDAGGDWTFEPVTEGVEVTWTFEGDAGKNPIGRYMGLMIDSMVGPYYQRGLDKLKQICEAMPEPMAAPADIAPADDDVDEYGEEPDDEDDAGASAVD